MIYKMILALCVVFATTVNAAESATASDPAATAQLTQLLEKNRNVKGQFHQATYDEKGKEVQVSNGVFILAKPNRFVWNSVEPYAQRIISDGKMVLVWDVDLQQATKKPLAGEVGRSPAALLGRPAAEILPHYVVTKLDNEKFRLAPKNKDEMFKTLTMSFKGDKIQAMSIVDGLGQTTLIVFKNVETHKGEPAGTFSLAVPDDVDVIQAGQ